MRQLSMGRVGVRGSGVTGRVVGWARATGLLLALVFVVCLFAGPALAGTTVGTPGAATPVSGTVVLLGVACSSTTSCLAVGEKSVGHTLVGVVVPITYAPGVSGYGTLTRTSREGANSTTFTGRIGSTALTPGSYQATLTATDAAQNTSRAQTIRFTIVKR